jgi:hypothetical protein
MPVNRLNSSRAGRYLTRVLAHVRTLSDDAGRRVFLSREMTKWEERYARFIETGGLSHRLGDSPGEPTAFDFVETIAGLETIYAGYAEGAAA